MRNATTVLILAMLTNATACDPKQTRTADNQRDGGTKTAAAAKIPPREVPDAKPGEVKTAAVERPAPTPAAAIEPAGDGVPTARPTDVPEDWQRVSGDVWSFWAPKDWKVSRYEPGDGGSGDKGDQQAEAQRSEGGMAISSLTCWIRSDQGLPTAWAALKKDVLARAKADARGHHASVTEVEVEHGAGAQKALQVEYAAAGDGTRVIERWGVSARTIGLVCSDQSGSHDAADRKTLETAIGSLRWKAGTSAAAVATPPTTKDLSKADACAQGVALSAKGVDACVVSHGDRCFPSQEVACACLACAPGRACRILEEQPPSVACGET